jgi:hypothetical protein
MAPGEDRGSIIFLASTVALCIALGAPQLAECPDVILQSTSNG